VDDKIDFYFFISTSLLAISLSFRNSLIVIAIEEDSRVDEKTAVIRALKAESRQYHAVAINRATW